MGARDGNNRIVSPHVRLFPHNNSENPSYSLPSTIRCSFAQKLYYKHSTIFEKGKHDVFTIHADTDDNIVDPRF